MKGIRNHRERRGLTQAQLAERVGISTPYLSQIERGANDKKNPNWEIVAKLAHQLQVPIHELFADDGMSEPDAVPFTFDAETPANNSVRARLMALSRHAKRPEIFEATRTVLPFCVLKGDFLLLDLGRAAVDGDLVLATLADPETGEAVTVLRRLRAGALIGPDPNAADAVVMLDGAASAAIMGSVFGVVRLDRI